MTRRLCREVVVEVLNMMVSPKDICLVIMVEMLVSLEVYRSRTLVLNIVEEAVMFG